MPLHTFKEAELRQYCKEYIEALELWLRRIIDETLRTNYGDNYFEYQDANGANLISNPIRKEIEQRIQNEPERYTRPIDACLLESEIKIVTNPDLYRKHFKNVFQNAFPEGRDVLRRYLDRLVEPRNKLYHANPISVREAERIICYSNDIIDAVKDFYQAHNMSQDYNVPLIIKYSDSFGNVLYRNQFHGDSFFGGKYIDFSSKKEFTLRPGDKISMEVEIDPTFSNNEYTIEWSHFIKDQTGSNQLTYTIEVKDVGEAFSLRCSILSNKVWHKHQRFDDMLVVKFKVLPPL